MRPLKLILYLLLVVVVQTVVFARLNFFGVSPDLILVAVICFAVLDKGRTAVLFAGASGLIQDIMSFGLYINTITKVVIASLVTVMEESLLGDDYSMVASLVAVFTPLSLLVEAAALYLFAGRGLALSYFALRVVLGTLYNLILVPICLPLTRRLLHEKK
jgi:rod shape-determining protein MreD